MIMHEWYQWDAVGAFVFPVPFLKFDRGSNARGQFVKPQIKTNLYEHLILSQNPDSKEYFAVVW